VTECANKKRKKERKSRGTGKREKKNHETETALFGCGSDEADDVTEDLFCFKNSGIPSKIFFFYDEEPQQYRYIDLGIFIVTITVNCT